MTTASVLLDELRACLDDPQRVLDRDIDRVAFAADASFYDLRPRAVAVAASVAEVSGLLRLATEQGVPLVFRGGGSSLAGQAVSDGVLVENKRHWRTMQVLDNGARFTAQPGLTIAQVNARLSRYGYKLGPDPSSASACTIGGMIANNSSGKSCGTELNAYETLESLVAVLPSGTMIDTGSPEADDDLRTREPEMHAGLQSLRHELLARPDLVGTIRRQFSMKNTLGYGLNALLDHDRSVDILAHLLVGSEGTLGFVAEATLRTVPIRPKTATSLLLFPDIHHACAALTNLNQSGPACLELLDNASLRVAASMSDPVLSHDDVGPHTAGLLAEWQAANDAELDEFTTRAQHILSQLPVTAEPELDTSRAGHDRLWKMRADLYPAVAGPRPSGTTPILEDVVVPTAAMATLCAELTGLFTKHGYDGIIFGHVKDGNIHFLVNQDFTTADAVSQYATFTEDVAALVLRLGGSLKAEHGTGRNMAPFLEKQWGSELTHIMVRIKRLLDPHGILNPGVILNDDPQAHLRNLKTTPPVDAEVDRCIECGYCEPVCPSGDLTLTPRQRITVQREIERRTASGADSTSLRADYDYDGLQTCAVDGMCAHACPVDINTGDLVRKLRAQANSAATERTWHGLAANWGPATRAGRAAIRAGHTLGDRTTAAITRGARNLAGKDNVPSWTAPMPGPGRPYPHPRNPAAPDAVYFPACINTMFGADTAEQHHVIDAFVTLCDRAGTRLRIPHDLAGSCCGTPWHSKGLQSGHRLMAKRMLDRLRTWTDDGALPVVVDATSCTHGLAELADSLEPDEQAFFTRLQIIDSLAFAREQLLPQLTITHRERKVVLHPTCSQTHLNLVEVMREIAEALADTVDIPTDWKCCGFAGDRGLLHPELTASATAAEAADVNTSSYDYYLSANRTCELALTRATGHPYQSIITLLETASRT